MARDDECLSSLVTYRVLTIFHYICSYTRESYILLFYKDNFNKGDA